MNFFHNIAVQFDFVRCEIVIGQKSCVICVCVSVRVCFTVLFSYLPPQQRMMCVTTLFIYTSLYNIYTRIHKNRDGQQCMGRARCISQSHRELNRYFSLGTDSIWCGRPMTFVRFSCKTDPHKHTHTHHFIHDFCMPSPLYKFQILIEIYFYFSHFSFMTVWRWLQELSDLKTSGLRAFRDIQVDETNILLWTGLIIPVSVVGSHFTILFHGMDQVSGASSPSFGGCESVHSGELAAR